MAAHKVLRGITYEGHRAEAGDIVTDIPAKSVPWLTEQGIIESTEGNKQTKPTKREQVSTDEGDE